MEVLSLLLVLFVITLAIWFYMLPGFIAERRFHVNVNAILLTNLFLGWTGAAWVAMLLWAIFGETKKKADLR